MTSKLQVTVPKAIADRFGIRPGDAIEWVVEGQSVRVIHGRGRALLSAAERLAMFDQATARQQARNRSWRRSPAARRSGPDRGWTRSEISTGGRAR